MTAQPVSPFPHRLATIPDRMALAGIRFYQRSISPHKGWRCAHRARHGGHSCSEWTKRAVARHGLRTGALLARRRFARCHTAATASRWESEGKKKRESVWTRPHACWADALLSNAGEPFDNVFTGLDCACCLLDFLSWFPCLFF